ncbi:MAG: LacI family DNA-binding transcriptional regulator [Anaerolineaceae bacterium]|nr:LacI family DNA-binding transcriptional regulator [Anaerolineaceae bacterium]
MSKISENSRATIDDVAERAGVSIATVSRVINKTGQVAEATTIRVWDAIASLDYSPHAAARGLASRRTNTIGLILQDISGEFFSPMLRGIEAGTREYGFDLLIHCTHVAGNDEPRLSHPLGEHNSDGIIIFNESLSPNEIRRLYRLQFPMVLLHRSPPDGLGIPYVGFENKSGARKLIDYLIDERGYRRIAFLSGPSGSEDSHWREMGYRESLAAHNIEFNPDLLAMGGFNEAQGQAAISQLLKRGEPFDAVFAADDDSAIGALSALKEAGLRVPEDIALVGFDDIRPSHYLTPPLTTVRAPIETAGREAVRQLISLIQTGKAEREILLPTELIIRRSCGASE